MSGIDAFAPGYIDKKNEVIVGLQTDAPLKRIVNPYGGIRMVYQELESYGYSLNKDVDKYFNEFRKHIIKVYSMLILLILERQDMLDF